MPQRKIQIPDTIYFCDPSTNKRLPEKEAQLTFSDFLLKLFSNPLWSDTFKQALAQRAIQAAYRTALEKGDKCMVIAEEDWGYLAEAAKTPRIVTPGGLQQGLGFSPVFASQLLPMLLAVIEAEQV